MGALEGTSLHRSKAVEMWPEEDMLGSGRTGWRLGRGWVAEAGAVCLTEGGMRGGDTGHHGCREMSWGK